MSLPILLEKTQRIAIVGVGLIGGSLALALRRAGYGGELIGYNRRQAESERALAMQVVDWATDRLDLAVKEADLIVLAVPPGVMPALMPLIRAACGGDAIVTDVGSTKTHIVETGEAIFGGRFIGAHPIAGKESRGVEVAEADLFVGARCVLTPTSRSDADALQLLRTVWQAAGCEVLEMTVADHDAALAVTSHLPHVLAFLLLNQLGRHPDQATVKQLLGGGFRDFSRIASSDPRLWADICLDNREALLHAMTQFEALLGQLREQLLSGDRLGLENRFGKAKTARDAIFDSMHSSYSGQLHDARHT